MNVADLYDRDFYLWTQQNAQLLRAGRAAEADLQHIAEKLEELGNRDEREIRLRLQSLLCHLLKWMMQEDLRNRSWKATIDIHRSEIESLLEDSPSLRPVLPEMLPGVYASAAEQAALDSGFLKDDFPPVCPFSLEQIFDHDYLPEWND